MPYECVNATNFAKGDTVCARFLDELHLGTYSHFDSKTSRHVIENVENTVHGTTVGTKYLPTGTFGKWQMRLGGRKTRRNKKTQKKRNPPRSRRTK